MSGPDALTVGTILVAAALAVVVCWPDRAAAAGRRVRRAVVPDPPPPPAVPAIEDLVRDLRRLRRETLSPAPGAPMVRRTATAAAYDDVLLQAARALDVPDTLSMLPPGPDREAERLRLEHLLRSGGLALD